MSRSYKKFPGFSDGDSCKKFPKRWAARKVRHSKNIPNGGAYRRLYNSWDICDYNCRYYSIADGLKAFAKWGWGFDYKYIRK